MVLFKAKDYLDELDLIIKNKYEKLETEKQLAIINVGRNKANQKYVELKTKIAESYGIYTKLFEFKTGAKKKDVLDKIVELGEDDEFGGIVVQYPLPSKFSFEEISTAINPEKDVDFFTSKNIGDFVNGFGEDFMPPTVRSLEFLLHTFKLEFKGKTYVVVGQGKLVGKPISSFLINKEATVYSLNEFSEDTSDILKEADVVICAAGTPKLLKGQMCKRGACVVDFSYGNKEYPGVGDFDTLSQVDHLNIVSGVPGGMGPLTVRFLFLNFLEFVERKFYT